MSDVVFLGLMNIYSVSVLVVVLRVTEPRAAPGTHLIIGQLCRVIYTVKSPTFFSIRVLVYTGVYGTLVCSTLKSLPMNAPQATSDCSIFNLTFDFL